MRNRNKEWERKREDNRNVAKILWADFGLCANNFTSAIITKTNLKEIIVENYSIITKEQSNNIEVVLKPNSNSVTENHSN